MLMHGFGVFQTKDGDEVRNTDTRAIEHLQAEGRARAIDISDFGPHPDHRDY
jgi:diketogulonate reductase-like aldo/keto reductase